MGLGNRTWPECFNTEDEARIHFGLPTRDQEDIDSDFESFDYIKESLKECDWTEEKILASVNDILSLGRKYRNSLLHQDCQKLYHDLLAVAKKSNIKLMVDPNDKKRVITPSLLQARRELEEKRRQEEDYWKTIAGDEEHPF